MLGLAARTASGSAKAIAAIALGSLALISDIALYVLDWMSTNNIAGM